MKPARLSLLVILVLASAALAACARPEADLPVVQAASAPATWPLTPPGCCPVAQWSADSERVFFYYRPENGPAGLWSVTLSGEMAFVRSRFGYLSADERVLVSQAPNNNMLIERLDSGASRYLPNGAVQTLPSSDGRLVAYFNRLRGAGRDGDSLEDITIAPVDSGEPVALLRLSRSDHLTWFPDGKRLLVFGWRVDGTSPGLWTIDIDTGAAAQIVAMNFLQGVTISPDGQWIAFLATLQSDPAANGMWIVRPDGSGRRRVPLDRAARWAADSKALLTLAPAGGGKEIHRLDLVTGARTVLASRDQVDFDVEANAWFVSPDGRHILYRSSRDRALWALQLPVN